jgi:hypothetical protein
MPSAQDASVINIDIPRTFKGDEIFSSRVSPQAMRRVLHCYSSLCHEQGRSYSYVQGLNIICGMFLYNCSEINAFTCLCAFTMRYAPSHYTHDIAGAHRAASCCDELLRHLDAEVTYFRVHDFSDLFNVFQLSESLLHRGCSSVVLALPAILVSCFFLLCYSALYALTFGYSPSVAAGNH